ncbi:MAG: hypothetical protein JNN15_03975 [Blastocatellia bacterium]|nr:hypothetical protein [Blastocatellia bacterium]
MPNSVVTVESLIVTRDELRNELKGIDAFNANHRTIVISTIERLVDEYVLKASDCPESGSGLELYDIEEVTGIEIPGLMMNLLDREMKGFTKMTDEELRKALESVGIETTDSRHRDKFYRCWLANEAFSIILPLLDFLKEPLLTQELSPSIKDLLPDERRRIKRLAEMELPKALSYVFGSTLKRIESFL